MTEKLNIADVAGIKLAANENFPPLFETRAALDHAFSQGSQGWGVTREVGNYLNLAYALHEALEVSTTAEENHRMLKGAQLENGRLKKKIEKLTAQLAESDATALALTIALEKAQVALDALRADNEELD